MNYQRGRTFEWKVRDALQEDGYDVLRSAGSKTKIDLVAIKPGQILFIQCKRTNGQIPPAEREKLVLLAKYVNALALVASQPVPRKPLVYRRLTGFGPKDWVGWSPDDTGEISEKLS